MAKQPRVVEYELVHRTLDYLSAPNHQTSCCMGAAFTDGERCTCWEPVVEPEPSTDLQEGPMPVNTRRCGDCAYRRDSPERQDLGGDTMPYVPGGVFMCHIGMPHVVRLQHPDGTVRDHPDPTGPRADYRPIERDGRAWQADGRPAVVCAGWAADHRAYEARPTAGTSATTPERTTP